MSNQLPLALCCGDPAGIGPEVIGNALRADLERGRDCVLVGPRSWAEPLAAQFAIAYQSVGVADYVATPGAPDLEAAVVALAAMEASAQGCVEGRYRGVVTGPVGKYWLRQTGFMHAGQTEFFASVWGGCPTMAFVGRELKVVLATWHIPLRDVADALTAACLEQAVRRADALAHCYGIAKPRIAVCGLNPHAGESGILGVEERDVLDPALDRLRMEFPGLSKCLPGDTVFFRQRRGEFDVVVAAYHDQALAAVKTLEFDSAVNVTLGLQYVRTSPDHGTAYELAGKGVADSSSFLAAIQVARQLA